MDVEGIKRIVLKADPSAKHYVHATDGGPYTTWRELRMLGHMADNLHEGGWAFAIDYFTKAENDPMAETIKQALDSEPGVAYQYVTDFEEDTGYIHHAFSCEGI